MMRRLGDCLRDERATAPAGFSIAAGAVALLALGAAWLAGADLVVHIAARTGL